MNALIDLLRSENIAYGKALVAANVKVKMKNFDGVGSVVPQAAEAMTFAKASLK